ncbi:hypothetical protein K450DRAFT_235862 [Umbelopsis ramanniana AG]|uniref:F-box domain-containing protein n=1 Tax=Umbelopsis ramanniana AG TaxID=1314678 RepID=A0AAD5HE10_UMBRA|nr:uncharacterized protein K450DRAFT_235862 [Umbelopsis ramanniana AG]KAI8580772.1 hypothetical protein K450DRAFT_235862 [Umbelopsis ramanniana AG]
MYLLQLPTEVLTETLLYLDDASLTTVALCNKRLSQICSSEILWKKLSASFRISDREQPPTFSYKALYQKLLTKYAWLLGLWQSNHTYHGSLLLVSFDPDTASIQGTLVRAQEQTPGQVNVWSLDHGVVIIDPKFHQYRQDLFRISLDPEGNVLVQLLQQGFQSIHWENNVNIVECSFDNHDDCPYLWSSVRTAMRHNTDRIIEPPSMPRKQSTRAFTFSLPADDVSEVGSLNRSQIPTQSTSSARKLFHWMGTSNAWLHDLPQFCKLPSSLTRIQDAIKPSHLNVNLLKQMSSFQVDKYDGFPEGLFRSYYGSHGLEYLIIRHDKKNHKLVCHKVTGDLNIPRSEISWLVPDTSQHSRVCIEEEFASALAYDALGHVAYQGFSGERMIPAELIIVNQDKLALHWRDLLQIIIYNRCTLEDFNQVLMQNSSW